MKESYPFKGVFRWALVPVSLAAAGTAGALILELVGSRDMDLGRVLSFAARGFAVGAALAVGRRPLVALIAGAAFGLVDADLTARLSEMRNLGGFPLFSMRIPLSVYMRCAAGMAVLVLGCQLALRAGNGSGLWAALGVLSAAAFVEMWVVSGLSSVLSSAIYAATVGTTNGCALSALVWLAKRAAPAPNA